MFQIINSELYKIFSRKAFIIATVVILAIVAFVDVSNANNLRVYGNLEEFYSEYYEGNEGIVTDEQIKAANEELARNNSEEYFNSISHETYNRRWEYAENVLFTNNESAENLKLWQDSIKKNEDEKLQKFGENSYEYRYAKLESNFASAKSPRTLAFNLPWNNFFDFSLLSCFIIALVIFGTASIISAESEKRTDSLLLTTKKGKGGVIFAKIIALAVTSLIITFLFVLVHFLSIFLTLGSIRGANALCRSYSNDFLISFFNFTNIEYFLVKAVYMFFGTFIVCILTLFFSSITKNTLASFFVSGIITAVPVILTELVNRANVADSTRKIMNNIYTFSYYNIVKSDDFFSNFTAYNIFGFPVLSCFVVPVLFILISAVFVFFSFRAYVNHEVK